MQFDLVFEGGGAKGSVFIGALQEFERRGHTARRLIGTSAGAITATLMAAGYSSKELSDAVRETTRDGKSRFSTFMDVPEQGQFDEKELVESDTYGILEEVDLPWIPAMAEGLIDRAIVQALMGLEVYRQMFSFNERGGLYAGEAFRVWLTKMLNAKEPELGEATLLRFHEIAHKKNGSELSLVASNSESQGMMVLNHRTAPECPVAWAVRMSMSIPFLWQEVRWKAAWGEYRGKPIDDNAIVDGGVLSNFPIHLLTTTGPDVADIMGDAGLEAVPNLGLLIDETLEVEGADKKKEGGPSSGLRNLETVRRIGRLVDTLTNSHDTPAIQANTAEICRLPAKGYGTTEFDMSPDRLTALIEAGKKAMGDYLDGLTYDLQQASTYAGCSPAPLRKAMKEGALPAERGKGNRYQIKQADLAEWMADRARDRLKAAMTEDGDPRVRSAMKELMDLLGKNAKSDDSLESAELWWRTRNQEREKDARDELAKAMKSDSDFAVEKALGALEEALSPSAALNDELVAAGERWLRAARASA